MRHLNSANTVIDFLLDIHLNVNFLNKLNTTHTTYIVSEINFINYPRGSAAAR